MQNNSQIQEWAAMSQRKMKHQIVSRGEESANVEKKNEEQGSRVIDGGIYNCFPC